tara:strand:- start:2206 stop:2421 length:216 start_codon:yes stop_codon:yes gene_type:complete
MLNDREWKIIKVCLENAPTPYDVGDTKKEVENLLKKVDSYATVECFIDDDPVDCYSMDHELDEDLMEYPPL